jgi:16S rRNA processing protein RimM
VRLETAGEHRLGRVVAASPHGRGLVLLALEGVEDRTAAQALVGFRIVIDPDDLPPPAADEFYYHEVVGFGVETPGGRRLGHIHTTFATGTNDVWIVRDDEGCREHLIPVIADVVRTIDRDAHRVVIEPLPGLLED